ncbi:MAG: phosphatidylglycerophosphatase A [Gammaproteobacteria bacterium]|nr:phosphatidylglycerophosphatase A [Gammaproteobacteria bacterium]
MNKLTALRHLWRNPTHLLAFGLGAGLLPAPGTFGTLLGVAVYLWAQTLTPELYAALCALLFVAGIWLCGTTARKLGMEDHPGIVWDEITGYLVTMMFAPRGWLWIALGFGLFRLFDIWKPWPINIADRKIKGGFGIMLDDVLAALYAMLALHLIYFITH